MSLRFIKMHGLGNDYVYIDIFEQHVPHPADLARRMSDRHRGVGSDGLILIAPPLDKSAEARMEMYNADGSRGRMCGNGIRCVAKYCWDHGRARRNPLRIETDAGVLALVLTLDAEEHVAEVRVDLGPPILVPADIPVALPVERVVDHPFALDEHTLAMTCVSMGNPHAVFFVEDLAAVPLARWGPQIERHALFPQQVNAHFAEVLRRGHLRMITWERGSGITQACGTGAAAVCVAGVLTGRSERSVEIDLPGGRLHLVWDEVSGSVLKTGPATEVFLGVWPGQ